MSSEERRTKRRATLVYDTGVREDDALERFQWVLPGVFLASALILTFTIVEWFVPHFPLLIFVAVVLIPMTLVLMWKAQTGDPRKVGLAVALVASFGLPLLGWNLGPYRAAALWTLGDYLPDESIMSAMADRSDRVTAMACERLLLSPRSGEWEGRVRAVLQVRPAVAGRCLGAVREEAPEISREIARYLSRQWFAEWMEGGVLPEETGCEAAKTYGATAELLGGEGVAELLMCSLGARTEEYKSCCGQALSESAQGRSRLAVNPGRLGSAMRESLFLELIEAVDLPAAVLMSAEPYDQSLAWTPAELFHWTTHLGCHLLDENRNADGVARLLSRSMERHCGLDIDDPLTSLVTVNHVRRTCSEALSRGEERQVDIVEWCDAARNATSEAAMEAARFVVSRAVSAFMVEGMDRGISAGNRQVERERRRAREEREEIRERIRSGERDGFVLPVHEGGERLREMGGRLRR